MTYAQLIQRVIRDSGEKDVEVIEDYIADAYDIVLHRRYPCGWTKSDKVPGRYYPLVAGIAVYLLNKRGAEGETRHDEDGVSRSYASAGVPEDMLKSVTPCCRVPGHTIEDDDPDEEDPFAPTAPTDPTEPTEPGGEG